MIDIKLIREHAKDVKENIKKRYQDDKLPLVDKILKSDIEWRKLKSQADSLRADRNTISKKISEAKKSRKPTKDLFKKAKAIPGKIEKIESRALKLRERIDSDLADIPNILHPKTLIGKDEGDNKEIRKWGKTPKFKFELQNHSDLLESLGLADFDAARKTSGQGFNYLLGEMAMLDHALQRYGVDFLVKKGFTLVVPPMMLNKATFLGAANGLTDIDEVVYEIDGEDLLLIGTAEHSLVGMMRSKVLKKEQFPIKLCALTSCFRKEIGSHGVDTKGLFRMHQFNKVEQVVFTLAENSAKMHEEMQALTEEFFKSLKIPYRVLEISSGDLSSKFSRQYDIEAWFPRQGKYAEITSAGNCTDFQARALNIKHWSGSDRNYPHILNNTMVATSRAMVAILENYQQKDGSVKVPTALQKYMHGKKFIGKK
jgi:seryl-tRNA synthetase